MKRHSEGMLWAVSLLSLIVAAMTSTKAYLPVIAIVWVGFHSIFTKLGDDGLTCRTSDNMLLGLGLRRSPQ
jgi:hypothetical protein